MRQLSAAFGNLRERVLADFSRYAEAYEPPPAGQSVGSPWSRDKVETEVAKMRALLVAPYATTYESGDELLTVAERLIGVRDAFVVADDDPYFLLFDPAADDFVLACKRKDSGALTAWGIRGDAASTFLSR